LIPSAELLPLGTPEATLEAASRDIGVQLEPGQAALLVRFTALLQRWNAVYNLTAVRDPASILVAHTLDCLAAVPSLRRQLKEVDRSAVLDVGSGGGLPGIVFAIANPEVPVTCIDAVGKKVAFITQVKAELGLRNLAPVHGRVERFLGSFGVVTSRAFSSLIDFVRLSSQLRSSAGVWMAMKGKEPRAELEKLPPGLLFHVEHLECSGLAGERCLVWLRPSTEPPTRGSS
jgi:16S rRNA (guanine527-N7)-methyltransferase